MIFGVRKNWLIYFFVLVIDILYDLLFFLERVCLEFVILVRLGDGDFYKEIEEGGGVFSRIVIGIGLNSGLYCYC